MMRRFLRGFLWGGLVGAAVGMYLVSDAGRRVWPQRYTLLRLRRQAAEQGAARAMGEHASRWQLAMEAGRAAVDAALALVGLRA